MSFGNDKINFDGFYGENSKVISLITERVGKHSSNIASYFDAINVDSREVSGTTHSYVYGSGEKFSDEEKFEFRLAEPSEDVRKDLIEEMKDNWYARASTDKNLSMEKFTAVPQYAGINIYGDLSRVGKEWKIRLKEEMEEKYYMNEVMGIKVFDIDKLIYVSWYYDNFDCGDCYENHPSLGMLSDSRSYLVEFDALLIRYASTLNESDFKALMDSVCIMITDKVARLVASERVFAKLIKQNVSNACSGAKLFQQNIYRPKTDPVSLFMAVLVSKVYCDSINGIATKNDGRSMEAIVDLAKLSLNNAGHITGLGKVSSSVFSYLKRSKVRGRYLERYMDTIVELVEQRKGGIVNSLNRSNKFSYNVNPTLISGAINKNINYASMEGCFLLSVEHISTYADQIFRLEDQTKAMFSILGLEGNENLDEFKKKTRAQLLAKITDKERSKYIKYESEVTRYRSDSINAKDDSKKNILLVRSRGIGKIIALEIARSKSDIFCELLASLDDARYDIDCNLSARDFNRERSSRMYGQIIPSGDWDY